MNKTDLKKLWDKEIKRIERLAAKAVKQGVQFDFDSVPKDPKKITKAAVERLQKIDLPFIKEHTKPQEDKVTTPKPKKVETKPKKPRKTATEEVEPRKARTAPVLTPEQRSARAKKAAQSRMKRMTDEQRAKMAENARKNIQNLTPEQRSARAKKAAETRRANETPEQREQRIARASQNLKNLTPEQRSERAKKAAETRKKNETPEQRSERAKKAAETRTKNKELKEEKEPKTKAEEAPETEQKADERKPKETPKSAVGIDPLTGEMLNEPKKAYSPEESEERHEKSGLETPIEESLNLIDTLKAELDHAVNQQVADLLLEALDDAISEHEIDGDYNEWYQSMNEMPSNIVEQVYTVKDDSDGERVRSNALAILIVIYGSYSNIPSSSIEQLEFLTSEYYYPRERWARQSKHRQRRRTYKANL
jgi:hypothetical protein